MEMKVVLKLELHGDNGRQKVMKSVSDLSGIDSISMDMEDKKMTVIGNVDPVRIVKKLKKRCHTQIISVGPAKEEKKEEPKKEEPNMEDYTNIYMPNYYYAGAAGRHYPNYYYYYHSNPPYYV